LKRIVTPALLAVFMFMLLPAQETTAETETESMKRPSPFRGFLRDAGQIWTYPLHIKAKDIAWLVAIAGTTTILIANDEGIYREIKRIQADNAWIDRSSPVLSAMCEGYPFAVGGLFLAHGLILRDPKSLDTGALALQAMVHSFLVVQVVKHLSGRQRPSWDGQDVWHGPYGFGRRYSEGFAKYDAFFSGHTVTIWSLATVLAHQYRGWVGPIAYATAALAGMATVTEDLHWVSDVLVGAAIGYAIGRLVCLNRRRDLRILPQIGPNRIGIGVSYAF